MTICHVPRGKTRWAVASLPRALYTAGDLSERRLSGAPFRRLLCGALAAERDRAQSLRAHTVALTEGAGSVAMFPVAPTGWGEVKREGRLSGLLSFAVLPTGNGKRSYPLFSPPY